MIWFWRTVLLFVALIGIVYWDGASLSPAMRKEGVFPPNDYDTYAQAASDTVEGQSPYALDGWISHPLNYRYHPFFALCFWLVTRLPGETGRALWTWMSLGAWWLALWLWMHLAERLQAGLERPIRTRGWQWLLPALAYPIFATAYIGNVSLLLTLLAAGAAWLGLSGRGRWAALACLPLLLTKPWWVVIPWGILALSGSWRVLARIVGWSVVGWLLCTLAGFALLGQAAWSVDLGDYAQWLLTASRLYPLHDQSAMFFTDQQSIRQTLARYVGVQPWIFSATAFVQVALVVVFGWRSWRLLRTGVGRLSQSVLFWPLALFVVVSLLTPQFEEFVLGGVAFALWRGSGLRRVRWIILPYWAYSFSAPSLWLAAGVGRPQLAILYDIPLLLIIACGVLAGAWWETGQALADARV